MRQRLLYLTLVLLALCGTAMAQTAPAAATQPPPTLTRISGTVTDADGYPLVGAVVVPQSGRGAVSTDLQGRFSIDAARGAVLTVSSLGYLSQQITVTAQDTYYIILAQDVQLIEDVVVVGYGVQKKATLTGAVVAVRSDDIVTTKNENIQNMLTGKMPGLRVVQRTSEPGAFNVNMDIRGLGSPLIVIDGVPRGNIERLDANDIESISVLKDASAAIYGVQAANGVILITTKSGAPSIGEGKIEMNLSSNLTWQYTAGLPKPVGALDFMIMSNEKGMNQITGGAWRYSQAEIDRYLSGERISTPWWHNTIRQGSPQTQTHVDIAGSGRNSSYFVSLGYQYQDSFFKGGDFNYNRYNVRANLSSKITRDLTLDIRLSGISDQRNRTSESARNIIYALWREFPVDPIYSNDEVPYYYNPTGKGNPVAMRQADVIGYRVTDRKWFQSSFALQYDAPFLRGLRAKAQMGYDYDMLSDKQYNKLFYYYSWNSITEQHVPVAMNSPATLRRTFGDNLSTLYQLSLNYVRNFDERHNVNALLLLEGRSRNSDGFYAQRELSIDIEELFAGNDLNQLGSMDPASRYKYANQSLVGRLNYDFKGRYLLEGAFRYDGSSRFPSSKRWGLFPSVSVGYRLSEEPFWKGAVLEKIDHLKLRASYGIMGDDSALDYQFLAGYAYPSSGYIFDGVFVNGVSSTGIPNRNITWSKSEVLNVGLDVEAWQGLLGASLDIFRRNRTGLLATSELVVPGTVGAELPQENLNSDRTVGYELELKHRNRVGEWSYGVSANVAFTRSMTVYQKRADYRNQWVNWRNNNNHRYKNIWWGLASGGQFQSWDQISEHDTHTARTKKPGDYYYYDWNGDGFVDSDDEHPIGFNSIPLLNFGATIDLSYRGFDLNMLLQGAAVSNVAYTSQLREPFWGGNASALEYFRDRWRPTDPNADPFDQFTEWIKGKYPFTGSTMADETSRTNMHSGRYLRLKNIELGYTIPASSGFLKRIGIGRLRVYANAYNLLTWSPLRFVDPEHPSDDSGYMYPLNRSISFGLNCQF